MVIVGRLVGARELMETPGRDARALHHALAELAWINRRLGGTQLVLQHLAALAPRLPSPLRLLDVATGYGDIPRAIAEWARAAGRGVEIVALDRDPVVARLADEASRGYPELRVIAADALALPFGAERFHVVLASLVLHHMERQEPRALLRELTRVASHAVLVNDLRRGWIALAGTWIGLRLLSRDRLIRHDGPLSVRRAFTEPEVLALARAAGWHDVTLSRHRWFRMALLALKNGNART